MRPIPLSVLPFLALAACSAPNPAIQSNPTTLAPLADATAAQAAIKRAAIRQMTSDVNASLQQYLSSQGCVPVALAANGPGPTAVANSPAASASASPASGASQVSQTNNQVPGVDEADFVKNDNQYIYSVANGALHIIAAWPAAQAHEIARVPVNGTPTKLFVAGDRLLVYAAVNPAPTPTPEGASGLPIIRQNTSCTYGYDCDAAGDGSATQMLIFDISNRSAPQLQRQIYLSGSLIAARRIGNTVHTVVATADVAFPSLPTTPSGFEGCAGNSSLSRSLAPAAFSDLIAKNTKVITETSLASVLPTVTDSINPAVPQQFLASEDDSGSALTSIVSFDMSTAVPASVQHIISRPGFVYAATDALYMAVRNAFVPNTFLGDGAMTEGDTSTLHKFTIGTDPSVTQYTASGAVKGHALNQYAMDEWQGNLRVAVSTGWVPDPNVSSAVHVLAQNANSLVDVGHVDSIAPGEDIRAVRFDGARGYLVTFKKTDPLFALDLTHPNSPSVLGELQIPGFSTYMHMMDANHLLTIGYDADDMGSFAWFSGILLQIFDVTNPNSPTQTSVLRIGTRGSSSEALADPLAFNYFAAENILALPMTICEGGSAGTYGTDMTFSGLIVYDVTTASGITESGRIAHPNSATGTGYDSSLCMNWWANASSEVKRSVIMDNFVYSISRSVIKVDDLRVLGTDVATISLQ